MRNVFQSFGIALLSTIVQTQTTVHTRVLEWNVRPDTMPGQFLEQLTIHLQLSNNLPDPTATVAAMQIMLGQITQQAAVLAFGDAYRVTFFAAVLAFFLGMLLPGKRTAAPRSPDEALAMGH
jgi:hypothetical protein